MDFADKYITNISKDDVKYACTYNIHSSYVFLGMITTWILSIMSTILTTLFLVSVFITIVNLARMKPDDDGFIIKLNESESEDGDSDSDNHVNSLSDSVLNDSEEVITESNKPENKKVN